MGIPATNARTIKRAKLPAHGVRVSGPCHALRIDAMKDILIPTFVGGILSDEPLRALFHLCAANSALRMDEGSRLRKP